MDYDSIMQSIQRMLGGGDGAQSFAAPASGWSPTQSAPGGAGSSGNVFNLSKQSDSSTGLGFNIGTGQMALSGIGTLGGLWAAQQGNKLANQQFKYQRGITDTNLNNQIKSYNTALTDRLTSRGVAQGQSSAEVQAEIEKNRLSR